MPLVRAQYADDASLPADKLASLRLATTHERPTTLSRLAGHSSCTLHIPRVDDEDDEEDEQDEREEDPHTHK